MKKVVVRLDLHDDKEKQKALKTASTVKGIDSIAMDMKEKKLTITGDVDPIKIASKLRKIWHAEIVSVGPAKEPKKEEGPKKEEEPKKEEPKKEKGEKEETKKEEVKKEETKKEEEKREEEKKEDAKKEEGEKKEEPKKEEEKKKDANNHVLELIKSYKAYHPHLTTHYHVQSVEENPNACVIS